MLTHFSIYKQSIIIVCLVIPLVLQSTFAADDANYKNALSNEAKRTRMTIERSSSDSKEMTNKSFEMKQRNDTVFKKVQRALGINGKADDKVVNDLEKAVSSSSEQVDNKADIRRAVSEAMSDSHNQNGSPNEDQEPKTLSKKINKIVNENRDAPASDLEQNYVRSLNKELSDESATKLPIDKSVSYATSIKKGYSGVNQANVVRTITVLKGESLSKISQRIYGTGRLYWFLYKANQDEISDPDFIKVGQVLQVPDLP